MHGGDKGGKGKFGLAEGLPTKMVLLELIPTTLPTRKEHHRVEVVIGTPVKASNSRAW